MSSTLSSVLIVAKPVPPIYFVLKLLLTIVRDLGFSPHWVLPNDFKPSTVDDHKAIVFVPATDDEVCQVAKVIRGLNARSPPVLATKIILINQAMLECLKSEGLELDDENIVVGLDKNQTAERWLRFFLTETPHYSC